MIRLFIWVGVGIEVIFMGFFNFKLLFFRLNYGNLGSGGFLILYDMFFFFYFMKGEGGDFKKVIKM